MSELTRRIFIQDGVRIVSVGLALPHLFTTAAHAADLEAGRVPSSVTRFGTSGGMAGRTLIVVQLAGGNDGLNTVVPYTDPIYRKNRPTIALSEAEMLPIDDRFALHGSMTGMKALWDRQLLGIVHGVGYPDPSYSHFASMDVWQTGRVTERGSEGVMARLVKNVVDPRGHPFAGFGVGNQVPPALASPDLSVPTVENPANFTLVGDSRYAADRENRENALIRLYESPGAGGIFASGLASTADAATRSISEIKRVHSTYQPKVSYPENGFASGMRLLAEAVCGDLGVKVGYITLGGFDTHSGQKASQGRLLQTFSDGLKAFWDDIEAHGRSDDVLVMTWSEFGRRVGENASGGTDHGSAGPQFVIGKGIVPGHWGDPVRLDRLDRGNLVHTTDFRSVYATVMGGWLGAPSDKLLGGRYRPLGFLGAP